MRRRLVLRAFSSVFIFVSLTIFAEANVEPVQMIQWFQDKTSIRPGVYKLVKANSDKQCSTEGTVSFGAENGFVTVFFDDGILTFGVGKGLYKTAGLVKGCDTEVATTESSEGLTVLKHQNCESGKGETGKQKILKTAEGFRIENQRKLKDGDWINGTNCSFARAVDSGK